LEWTRLSCWCLQNHKGCTYTAPVWYVTKTWSVVLLNEKIHTLLFKCIVYDKLLKPRQSFRITLYKPITVGLSIHVLKYLPDDGNRNT
jgi:hypothetical protein